MLSEVSLLQEVSLGDPEIGVAVLDGPVDLSHLCFIGGFLTRVTPYEVSGGPMSRHGTHVASVIFGQQKSSVQGIAPLCHGLILPIFREHGQGNGQPLSQIDLARAIEQAVEEGAQIINISGGERAPLGQANDILVRAIRVCERNNVLVVAAVGNDGCHCLHVPAALPGVLAVGAMGFDGRPLDISNWGQSYQANGVLAPGEDIRGAVPGGVSSFSGSSAATPIVSGAAALLLSIQKQSGRKPDPRAVRNALLKSAHPCDPRLASNCPRYLAGVLNIPGAYALINKNVRSRPLVSSTPKLVPARRSATLTKADVLPRGETGVVAAGMETQEGAPSTVAAEEMTVIHASSPKIADPVNLIGVAPSSGCNCGTAKTSGCSCGTGKKSNVFALGLISFDFGTEARRDSFRQLMPAVNGNPANPYNVRELCDYLDGKPWESTNLYWTLNLDATPIYAIEPEAPFAADMYKAMRDALRAEALAQDSSNYVGRVSVAGVLTSKTVQLFSGQEVPVVVARLRGFYAWNQSALFTAIKKSLPQPPDGVDSAIVDVYLNSFIAKVYYEFRNLGQNPSDRALNYSATNLFQAGSAIAAIMNPRNLIPGIADNTIYAFDSISVSKSPYCRADSDCWDVQLTFFNPNNNQTANIIIQFTVDVSDAMPVTVGSLRAWTTAPD